MNAQNVILFIIIITISCDEDLKIRIGVPEFICDKDGGVRDISNDMTTIRLLGKDATNVEYKFDVNFRIIGKKCRNNQRCTLVIWKAVRELDKYLKDYPPAKLQSGLIEINNTMFTPGIKYILNVTLLKDGKITQEQSLTLDYVDDFVKTKVTKPMASLLLLAPDTSYAYSPYVVNADINICSNITTYYFKWELVELTNSTLLPDRSSELTLPPNTLQALQTYTIKCSLVNGADGAVVANSQQDVNVLSKGLLLKLPVKKVRTRINQPVQIKAVMKDLDNADGDMRVLWSCIETTTEQECEYQSDSNDLEMDSGFGQPGMYKISVEVSKGDFTETDSCLVEVTETSPIIEINDIDYPANPVQALEVGATVYELKTFCTLQWTSPNEPGFEPLDLSTVPGNLDAITNVTMKEDFFLHELEEFTNGTIDRRHNLLIPPPSDTWAGLKGDTQYLFRLIITCPPEIDDFQDLANDIEPLVATSDVVVETNSPPKMGELEVTPLEGDAFVTTFSLKTQKGEDKEGDDPILYRFGYVLDGRDVVLWKLGDVCNCEVTLPYSDAGIQTFVESCDNFNSCARVLGPVVQTKLPETVSKEYILERFVSKMSAEDYARALTEAFVILRSYKTVDEEAKRAFISEKIESEIDKYLNMADDDEMRIRANDLLRNINGFATELQLPEAVLSKMLELKDKLSDETEPYTQRKLLSVRSKRGSFVNLYDVRSYLEVSELIITTSNDPNKVNLEKENLRKQLRSYMEKLCSNMKKPQLSLELKTLIFSIERLKKNSLNSFISIPFEGNNWQINARIKLGNIVKSSREKCIGKAIFKDYLGKDGITYFADILNSTDTSESADIVIYLPKNRSSEGTPNCVVYQNEAWSYSCKVVQNIANYVKCSCKSLGYYYLEYNQNQVTTVAPTTRKVAAAAPTTEKVPSRNETLARLANADKANYDTISYVVIAASVIGIIILAITIRKIFHDDDDDDNEEADTFDFPKYAQLHDEEFLSDAHI